MAHRRSSLGPNGGGVGERRGSMGKQQQRQQQIITVPFYPPAFSKRPPETVDWTYWVGGDTCSDMSTLYDVQGELGRPGAYGYAVLATRKSDGTQVAVKVCLLVHVRYNFTVHHYTHRLYLSYSLYNVL